MPQRCLVCGKQLQRCVTPVLAVTEGGYWAECRGRPGLASQTRRAPNPLVYVFFSPPLAAEAGLLDRHRDLGTNKQLGVRGTLSWDPLTMVVDFTS